MVRCLFWVLCHECCFLRDPCTCHARMSCANSSTKRVACVRVVDWFLLSSMCAKKAAEREGFFRAHVGRRLGTCPGSACSCQGGSCDRRTSGGCGAQLWALCCLLGV